MAMKYDGPLYWAPIKKLGGGWIAFKDSPSPPQIPDPNATAAAQTASNQQTARTNAQINRVNQYTPWGNLTYSQNKTPDTFNQAGYDAAMQKYQSGLNSPASTPANPVGMNFNQGRDGSLPVAQPAQITKQTAPNRADFTTPGNSDTWNATVNLSPEQQKLLDSSNQISQSMADLGQNQLGAVSNAVSKPLDFSGAPALQNGALQYGVDQSKLPGMVTSANYGNIQNKLDTSGVPSLVGGDALSGAMNDAQKAAYNQQTSYLDPQWKQQQHDLENQLTQQGVMQNSDAWNRSVDDFNRNKTFAYNQATQSAIGLGNQAQNQLFNQGLAANQNAFSQAQGTGTFANAAQAQGFGQNQANAQLNNNVADSLFNRGLANAQLNNSAAGQGFAQSDTARNQAINELMTKQQNPLNILNSLRTGSQVTSPQFGNVPQTNVAGTDIGGLINNAYNQQMGQYNAQQQANNGITGGLFSLGSAALPGALKMLPMLAA